MIEDQLREIILKKFKNVKECAKAADVPYTTLDSILKRGVNKANVLNIIRLCGVLGIDTDALADGKIIPKHECVTADVDDAELDHIKKYRSLNKGGKQKVDGYTEALLSMDEFRISDSANVPNFNEIKQQFGPQIEAFHKNQKSPVKK